MLAERDRLLLPLAVARPVVGWIDMDESLAGLGSRRERVTQDRGDFLAGVSPLGADDFILARDWGNDNETARAIPWGWNG